MAIAEDDARTPPAPDRFLLGLAFRLVGDYERAASALAASPGDPVRSRELAVAGGAVAIVLAALGGIARFGDTIYEAEGGRLRVRRGVPDLTGHP